MARRGTSHDEVKQDILQDPEARAAYLEARCRRRIADHIAAAMKLQGVSHRQLAERMGTGKSQVRRLLNQQRGGSLTLLTVVRAALALSLEVEELFSANVCEQICEHYSPERCGCICERRPEPNPKGLL